MGYRNRSSSRRNAVWDRLPYAGFEAGALSKTSDALVWTFLVGLSPSDVTPPLSLFQHTEANEQDILRLLNTINGRLESQGDRPLAEGLLVKIFNKNWPAIESDLLEATFVEETSHGGSRKKR